MRKSYIVIFLLYHNIRNIHIIFITADTQSHSFNLFIWRHLSCLYKSSGHRVLQCICRFTINQRLHWQTLKHAAVHTDEKDY